MFISIMKYEDFIHMSVAGDGACFFHSLAAIISLEGKSIPLNQTMKQTETKRNTLAKKLRKQCVDWLENNLDYEIAQISMTIREEIEETVEHCKTTNCGNYENVKEYLKYMRQNKSYAGQIEIYAMAYSLGRSIRVFIKNKGKFKSAALGFGIGLKPDIMDDIHIYHNMGENVGNNEHHFEPLYPKIKAEKEIKEKGKKTEKVKPTSKPTSKPTRKTTRKPTRKTTRKPTRKTRKPTRKTTRKPTRKPTRKTTRKTTRKPTRKPTRIK